MILNIEYLQWPPITRSMSGHKAAICLSRSIPEWPKAIIILTPSAFNFAASVLKFKDLKP